MLDYEELERYLCSWLAPLNPDHSELFLVGGAVRDYLLGREIKDCDLVCAEAKQVAESLAGIWKTSQVCFEKQAKACCYRVIDPMDCGRFLDIAPMREDDLHTDLNARDFSINALAMEITRDGFGRVIDPLHGRSDLEQKIVRMTSANALDSDPLRILRAFRFSAQLDFKIDHGTDKAVREKGGQISKAASERVVSELLSLLGYAKSFEVISNMDNMGVLQVIFPEILPMKGCTQNSYHHLEVWGHSLAVMQKCEHIINNLPEFFPQEYQAVQDYLLRDSHLSLLKLAALLHDVGKPRTKGTNQQTGRITFYAHDKQGVLIVQEICNRLKMSKQATRFLTLLVEEHLHVLSLFASKVKASTVMKFFRKTGDESLAIFILCLADIKGALGEMASSKEQEKHIIWTRQMVQDYLNRIKKQLERKELINGRDLLDLGFSPGPQLGRILKEVTRATDDGEISTREDALKLAREYLWD